METSWGPDTSLSLAMASPDRTAARMMLGEIARDRVDLVAAKMNVMPEAQLQEIGSQLCLIMQGLDGGRHVDEFLHLEKLVHGRVDFTPAMLETAHQQQLRVLVAIKTRNKKFMHPFEPPSELADVLLERRCQKLDCFRALPAYNCECDVCATKKGFCNNCMCMICGKFDLEFGSRCYVRCDTCRHRAHTDCAVDSGRIEADQKIKNGIGDAETLFRCRACQGTSEVLKWVRLFFQEHVPYWDMDVLIRECGSVLDIFRESENSKEGRFLAKCAELFASSVGGSDLSTCRAMLLQELQEIEDIAQMHEALERMLIDTSAEPTELSYAFLKSITNGFSTSREIGRGGFGVVYMGVLQNEKIAVKKLSQTMNFSDKQFHDELTCLRRVKHKNIVRFLGYCSDTKEKPIMYQGRVVFAEVRRRFLCFEYVPNKNLHDYLKDQSHAHDWDTRCRFIEGICDGLHYLHNNERITHLDLKPENILLDADMIPKITDFGLSRRFSGGQSRIITENIRGSQGYIAPEYWSKGEISFKSDIFSLGVIIRRLFCGSIDSDDFEKWYLSLTTDSLQVMRCIKVSQLCVDDDQRKRPTIHCIIDMLSEKETRDRDGLASFWPPHEE